MNNKFRELIEQAGTDTSGKWISIDNAEYLMISVIQECAQFCEDKNSKLLGTMIKNHFGVDDGTSD